MATDTASAPVNGNGNYAPHAGYGGVEQQQHNNYAYTPNNAAASNQPPSTQTPPVSGANQQQPEISKDEVGWYFVEQYYTTMSRSPEKLALFYNKRSTFVSGDETEKVPVCLGYRAIQERIKELDFQDCKVRVTNVDSQASDSNIVIQVIGEISNKHQPHRKFTQTFVLATQTNGYFVLNDIFRYLIDEEDEPEQEAEANVESASHMPEPSAEPEVSEPAAKAVEPSAPEPAATEQNAEAAVPEPEQSLPAAEEVTVNGSAKTEKEPTAEEAPAAPAITTQDVSTAIAASTAEESVNPEPVKTPEPAAQQTSAAKAPTPEPAAAPKPAAPRSWASLAASANKVATPVAPSAPSSNSQPKSSTSTVKPATPTASAAPVTGHAPPAAGAPAAPHDDSPTADTQSDEWTAVSNSHNRQHSKVNVQQEPPNSRGFIKNVTSNVDPNELKAAIDAVAEVTYFDVAHEKNCAFIDFRSPEAYQAAVAASPFTVGGERLWVMQRYTKNNNPGFTGRGGFRGNDRGRGNMNQGPPRGAFQGRGGFRGEFRGNGNRGGTAPRGRGGPGSSQAV